jgi:hypothetical protein
MSGVTAALAIPGGAGTERDGCHDYDGQDQATAAAGCSLRPV